MSLNVHYKSLKGLRDANEDQHVVILNADGRDKRYASVNLFCVFDGHGGKFVSGYLKKRLPDFLLNKDLKYPLSEKYINKVYDIIQDRLATKYKSQATHCGSTCLVVIHYFKKGEKYVQVINAGDSRAVLCRNSNGIPLTVDHKPGLKDEKARIKKVIKDLGSNVKIEWDGHDYRIKDLSVSRAFGDIDATPYVTHRPEIYLYKLSRKEGKDAFIILACDGLWDVKNNQTSVDYVMKYVNTTKDKKLIYKDKRINIANSLGVHSIEEGSGDNVTNVIVFFGTD